MEKLLFAEKLASGRPIVIDGGLATQCEAMGCDISGELWSARLLQSDPQAIVAATRAFLDAGAEIIATASYQASRGGFMSLGMTAGEADALIASSVDIAVQARDQFLADNPHAQRKITIAASIGPYGAAQADGSEYTGNYGVAAVELKAFHAERLRLLDNTVADLLACETVPSYSEAEVLAELLQDARSPAWVSFSCRDDKSISDGTPIEAAVSLFQDHPRVLAVGVNCTPPQFIVSLIGRIRTAVPGKAIVVYPNSGETWQPFPLRKWTGTSTPTEWAIAARAWADAGASLIGGCCRTGPEHIRAIANSL